MMQKTRMLSAFLMIFLMGAARGTTSIDVLRKTVKRMMDEKVDIFNAKIVAKNERIRELEASLSQLGEENQGKEVMVTARNEVVTKQATKIEELEEHLRKSAAQLQELKNTNKSLENKVLASDAVVMRVEKMEKERDERDIEHKKDLKKSKTIQKKLSKNIQKLRQDKRNVENCNEKLRNDLEALRKKYKKDLKKIHAGNLKGVRKALRNKDEEKTKLENKLCDMKAKVESYESALVIQKNSFDAQMLKKMQNYLKELKEKQKLDNISTGAFIEAKEISGNFWGTDYFSKGMLGTVTNCEPIVRPNGKLDVEYTIKWKWQKETGGATSIPDNKLPCKARDGYQIDLYNTKWEKKLVLLSHRDAAKYKLPGTREFEQASENSGEAVPKKEQKIELVIRNVNKD